MSCDAMTSGGGEPPKLESQRSIPTPFLTKTYQIVDDPSLNDLISWTEDGTAFVVWQPAEFSRDLLPKYFKHNNFSSFVRQLNTYGFRKVAPDRWEFANDYFRRGEKAMLRDIQRRKISAAAPAAANSLAVAVAIQISQTDSGDEQVLSSNSSPAGTAVPPQALLPEILEENDRLKKENSELKLELSRLKTLCGSICSLMSSYAANPGEAERIGSESTPEILPETGPRIFGVPIGDKRLKMCENGEGDDRVVKSEPLDIEGSDGHDVGSV